MTFLAGGPSFSKLSELLIRKAVLRSTMLSEARCSEVHWNEARRSEVE